MKSRFKILLGLLICLFSIYAGGSFFYNIMFTSFLRDRLILSTYCGLVLFLGLFAMELGEIHMYR